MSRLVGQSRYQLLHTLDNALGLVINDRWPMVRLALLVQVPRALCIEVLEYSVSTYPDANRAWRP